MPKIIDYDKKKEEIIKKAILIFIKKGYYNTKLSDIAKECGMGRTTLYQYFKNKEEIFHYVIKYTIKTIKKDLNLIIKDPKISSLQKIKKIIYQTITKYNEDSMLLILIDLWLILKRENNQIAQEIQEHALELRKVFKALLEEAENLNEIKPINKEMMSYVLYGLIESSLLQASIDKNIDTKKHFSVINILVDGLKY
ncbi:TetR/AcrR family transcriptional regulator [Thermohalobacter berrensis]|uniref:TetR family transcriptional regulator n=1 Tax=Thermohalobacter berrensis TaxID=99594 RepID=A0A419T5M3_9FIRM|nr:TetR/AcrR family transcriptional regulator [Thermohalobacter berrensis]RKD32729.1 TetR family transcriptional regulator [Thermohalobacter berrensis]